MIRASLSRRRGFTLVELLVVVGISLALAALAAGVGYSGMIGSQRTVSSADRVSGWLILSKQRALRDSRPNGVRFSGKQEVTNGPVVVTEAQYIETPEPYVPSTAARLVVVRTVSTPYNEPADAPNLRLYFASTNPNDITELLQRVTEGDRVLLHGLIEANYQIVGDSPIESSNPVPGDPGFGPPAAYQFVLLPLANSSLLDLSQRLAAGHSPPATPGADKSAVTLVGGFGFQSKPQPVLGEPVLQITEPMMIDARVSDAANASLTSTTVGVDLRLDPSGAGYTFDVLFKPSGALVGSSGGVVCLWLRDKDTLRDGTNNAAANPRSNYNLAGQQLLVVVAGRTGLISTQPVNDDLTKPYLFATDGKNNGV